MADILKDTELFFRVHPVSDLVRCRGSVGPEVFSSSAMPLLRQKMVRDFFQGAKPVSRPHLIPSRPYTQFMDIEGNTTV